MWPSWSHRIVHWFLPYCRQLRKDLAICRRILSKTVAERKAKQSAQEKQGKAANQVEDSLEWMEKFAQGKSYDPAVVQLSLSMAAIHTTTDLMTWLLLCIAQHPECVHAMRQEIVSVLNADGWKKTSLYNLKLMDSVMKESQRLKPNVLGKINPSSDISQKEY